MMLISAANGSLVQNTKFHEINFKYDIMKYWNHERWISQPSFPHHETATTLLKQLKD